MATSCSASVFDAAAASTSEDAGFTTTDRKTRREAMMSSSTGRLGGGTRNGLTAMLGRCIALIDMDCFYVQVEERLQPHNRGKPGAVVQYVGPLREYAGGLIAVNYEARAKGVKRGMRQSEARALCPNIILYPVPEVRKKADLTRYRLAGGEVLKVFCSYGAIVERASIDEAYIDLTALVDEGNSCNGTPLPDGALADAHVEGFDDNLEFLKGVDWRERGGDAFLARGAEIMMRMRRDVLQKTQFTCSAGISHNKVVAKLAAGLHKPNQLTVVPHSSVRGLFENVRVNKIRGLGGKFGEHLAERLAIQTMAQLADIPSDRLIAMFGEKTGMWLYELSHGIDHEAVEDRLLSKSLGCAKTFPGKSALVKVTDVSQWTNSLCQELEERLKEDQRVNRRIPRLLTVSNGVQSKSCQLSGSSLSRVYLYNCAMAALAKLNVASRSSGDWAPPVVGLQFNASKFEALDGSSNIMKYMTMGSSSADQAMTTASTTKDLADKRITMASRLWKLMSTAEEDISLQDRF